MKIKSAPKVRIVQLPYGKAEIYIDGVKMRNIFKYSVEQEADKAECMTISFYSDVTIEDHSEEVTDKIQ